MDVVDAKPTSGTSRRGSDREHLNDFSDGPRIRRRRIASAISTPLSPNSNYYSMNGERRGKVLIFNHRFFDDGHPERKGSENDVQRLKNTLPQLGFRKEDIQAFDDYDCSEIELVAKELTTDKELVGTDCLMVVILTHGDEEDKLLAKDDSYHLYKFMENFTPTALPSMAGKPKLFIVQACRGTKRDRGVSLRYTRSLSDHADSLADTFSYPEFADFLIVMSSHHGHISYRNENGSWLIQELCNVIEKSDLQRSSILDILTDTNDAVSKRSSKSTRSRGHNNKKQISSFYSTMTKRLYFDSS